MTKLLKRDTHGHVQCYNAGCRCEECKQAHTVRMDKARKAREAKKLDPNDPRHGTVNLYRNFGCRCVPCTKVTTEYNEEHHEAWRRRQGMKYRGKVPDRFVPDHLDPNDSRHGTPNFYKYYGCRCRACTDAKTAQERIYQARYKNA